MPVNNPATIVYNSTPKSVAASMSSYSSLTGVNITDEDRTKYQKYFLGLYNSLNNDKPSYHEFVSMIDVVGGNSNPAVFYPKIFSGFQIQGLKSDFLLLTAQNTLDALKLDAVNFNKKMQDKITTEIGGKKKTIEQKSTEIEELQKKIAQLGSEIVQLSDDIKTSEEKINNGLAVYDVFSKEIISKVENDISNIQQFVK